MATAVATPSLRMSDSGGGAPAEWADYVLGNITDRFFNNLPQLGAGAYMLHALTDIHTHMYTHTHTHNIHVSVYMYICACM